MDEPFAGKKYIGGDATDLQAWMQQAGDARTSEKGFFLPRIWSLMIMPANVPPVIPVSHPQLLLYDLCAHKF